MPLLTCPISGEPMKQVHRHGIELDVSAHGVWLDRGELEKLMALVREAALEEAGTTASPPPPPASPRGGAAPPPYADYRNSPPHGAAPPPYRKRDDDDDYDDDDRYKHGYNKGHPHGYKKKKKMSDLLDIFDF